MMLSVVAPSAVTLAGSTVMLLTIAWGGSLIVGRCDLHPSRGTAINKTLTPKTSITEAANETGVTTDTDTKTNAMVMMASCVTFLIVQIPAWMGMEANRTVHLITAAVGTFTYLALASPRPAASSTPSMSTCDGDSWSWSNFEPVARSRTQTSGDCTLV